MTQQPTADRTLPYLINDADEHSTPSHSAYERYIDPGQRDMAIRFVAGVSLPPRRPAHRFRKPPLEQIDPIRRWAWWVRAYRPVAPELLQRHP